jgi:hypothetical protein
MEEKDGIDEEVEGYWNPGLKPEYSFDMSQMEKSEIQDLHQEGNYLVGTTNMGLEFRQHIPANKILNKKDGHWVLEDMQLNN